MPHPLFPPLAPCPCPPRHGPHPPHALLSHSPPLAPPTAQRKDPGCPGRLSRAAPLPARFCQARRGQPRRVLRRRAAPSPWQREGRARRCGSGRCRDRSEGAGLAVRVGGPIAIGMRVHGPAGDPAGAIAIDMPRGAVWPIATRGIGEPLRQRRGPSLPLRRCSGYRCHSGSLIPTAGRAPRPPVAAVVTAAAPMEADGAVDGRALREELRAALEADERHERENSAKLRAVRQRVGSYREFRWARRPAAPRSTAGRLPGLPCGAPPALLLQLSLRGEDASPARVGCPGAPLPWQPLRHPWAHL